jgi:hypothetical protein
MAETINMSQRYGSDTGSNAWDEGYAGGCIVTGSMLLLLGCKSQVYHDACLLYWIVTSDSEVDCPCTVCSIDFSHARYAAWQISHPCMLPVAPKLLYIATVNLHCKHGYDYNPLYSTLYNPNPCYISDLDCMHHPGTKTTLNLG